MIIFIDYSSNSDAISLYNNMDGTYRQIIDRSHVDLLKSKITHSICGCNRYFKENHISGLHTGFLITLSFTAYLCDIFEYDDEDIEKLVMPLMLSIRDNIEIEDYNEMKKTILQQYDADDPITMFNRQSIIVL